MYEYCIFYFSIHRYIQKDRKGTTRVTISQYLNNNLLIITLSIYYIKGIARLDYKIIISK